MTLFLMLLMTAFGFFCGSYLANQRWTLNSQSPARICQNDRFYKVVELRNEWSADMLEIHMDEIKSAKEQ